MKYIFVFTYIFVKKNTYHCDVKDTGGVNISCCFQDCVRSIMQFLVMSPEQMNTLLFLGMSTLNMG